MYKTHHVRTTFGSWDVEKSARRCGAKHISKLKTAGVRTTFGSWDVEKVHAVVARSTFRNQNVKKHQGFGPLLEVQMSKKCMPLWREAHFEVKIFKTLGVRTTFGGSDVASLHYTTLHYTTLHYTTLQDISLHYTPVHYITLHYTPLHSTTLNYTTLHYITLHYTTFRHTPLHHTTLHYTTLHWMTTDRRRQIER